MITEENIRRHLSKSYGNNMLIQVLDTIDSTNTYAKNLLRETPADFCCMIGQGEACTGEADGAATAVSEQDSGGMRSAGCRTGLIVAREQTAGRGRQGKQFSSLRDNGIYMTLMVPVHKKPEEVLFITSAVAVAVARVLEAFSEESPKIKWVNDIWLGDQKICGILTEAVTDYESGLLEYAVIGIGINAGTELSKLPREVQAVAGSIGSLRISKSELIARVAEEVLSVAEAVKHVSEGGDREALLSEYKSRSMIIGREIFWEESGVRMEGKAVDINEEGNLIVETDGGTKVLNSGLVSVRPLGYAGSKTLH